MSPAHSPVPAAPGAQGDAVSEGLSPFSFWGICRKHGAIMYLWPRFVLLPVSASAQYLCFLRSLPLEVLLAVNLQEVEDPSPFNKVCVCCRK